jgi:hypothetical protein
MREGLGGLGRKSKRDRGLSTKRPSPSSRIEQGCSPAAQCMATTGRWDKMERRPRGSQPRAHLGLGLLVEAAPRRGVGDGGG